VYFNIDICFRADVFIASVRIMFQHAAFLRFTRGQFDRPPALVAVFAALTLLAFSPSAWANDPPVVTNPTVAPTGLSQAGGIVTVNAHVTDDSNALDIVFIEVRGPLLFSTAMTRGGLTPDDWYGSVALPSNDTNQPVNWDVYVRALDLEEAETTVLAGTAQVAAQAEFDEPPSVFDPAVSPRDLSSAGGSVMLSVSAWDLRGISEAYAVVTAPGGVTTHVVLDPISADRFQGVFNAPANAGVSPAQYSVLFRALDDIGQETTLDGGVFTVAVTPVPTGQLKIDASVNFGSVKIGSKGSKTIKLRNDGKKTTGPVNGLLIAPNAPFFLVGAVSGGVPFTLRAGETKSYTVEFRPTAISQPTATIVVRRADGSQSSLTTQLSGRGVAAK
jgi:hypothetical protein